MIVITDTSVVLNLCWLRHGSLLSAIYEDVLAPGQVRLEFDRKTKTDPRFAGLLFPPFITLADPTAIPAFLTDNNDLDYGEIAAIALALERGIADVLIDEKAGRAAALALGLHVSEGVPECLIMEIINILSGMVLREASAAPNAIPAELPDRSQRLGMGRGGRDFGWAAQTGPPAAL